MDHKTALHTEARRYCIERELELFEAMEAERAERQGNLLYVIVRLVSHTRLKLGERRDVVAGILRRIEAVRPSDFASVEAVRTFLLGAAEGASLEDDTRPLKEAAGQRVFGSRRTRGAERVREDERALFRNHIHSLSGDYLNQVQPLPHRRLVGEHEAERLWRRLQRKWEIPSKGYWWPLGSQGAPPPHVLAFNSWEFEEHVPDPLLRDWLHQARARPILQFDNDNPGEDYEMDLELFVPGGAETYWTSPKMDWALYSSHEDSITVGGEWLLNLVKRVWPEWESHLRTTHTPPETQ